MTTAATPTRETWADLCGPEAALAWAFGGSFVAVTVAQVLALPQDAALLLLVAVVSLSARRGGTAQAVAAGVFGWLFLTGFVIDRYGELHYHGLADVLRLLLLVCVAVASARHQSSRTARPRRPAA